MVQGVRGPGGGYQLCRNAAEINVAEIIAAVDEHIDATRCGGKSNCQDQKPCLTHDLWMGLSDQIRNYLSEITLQQLLENQAVNAIAARQDQDSQKIIHLHRPPLKAE